MHLRGFRGRHGAAYWIGLALAAAWAVWQARGGRAAVAEGAVARVGDGDTFEVARGRERIRVRLYGIDAPELDQAFGPEARDFLARLALGRVVTLEEVDVDRYGRRVAIARVDGENLNRRLVAEGLAWVYTRHATRPESADWRADERAARAARRGLWAGDDPQPPWERPRHRR